LEQLTPFCLLPFENRPPSCYLHKTITVLMMCGAEACPLLIVVLNRSIVSLMGWWKGGNAMDRSEPRTPDRKPGLMVLTT
jgi:hypothetical protein